jgi:transcriptional regulator with XRE-family HTH domain
MTNAELASLLGLSESGASRLRNGHRRPSWSSLNAVARAFDWPAKEQFEIWNRQGGKAYAAALLGRIGQHETQAQERARREQLVAYQG